MHQRISWDTSVKHFVRLGLTESIPNDLISKIPKTNIHRWKKENNHKYLGCELTQFVNEELELIQKLNSSLCAKKVIKAYFRLSDTLHDLLNKVPSFNKVIKKNKQKIVETVEQIKNDLPIEQSLSFFSISRSTYQNYKNIVLNKCSSSYFDWCVHSYPNQLMKKEVEKIKAYFEDENYKYWSKISLYYLGLRNKDFAFCKTTFYKYANLLGYSTLRHLKSKQKYQSLATSKRNEIWCADVTKYKLSDGSSYSIHLLMDHYSRKVLGCKISKTPQAINITTLIKNAIVNTKEPPNYFLTDGGSENCNLLVKKLTNETQIKHLIAQKDISFSNSGIEALNKILKHQFLRKKIITTEKQLKKEISDFITTYNNHRPHGALNGYTPNERYNNSRDFEWFSTAIKQQKNERSKHNKVKTCKKCVK